MDTLVLNQVGSDVRYAMRLLRKAPGFTLTAIVVIAIGIGANSAIFSLVDTLLLRPLPYTGPDRIVKVWERPPRGERNSVAPLNFQDWQDQNKVFDKIAAIRGGGMTLTTASGGAERIPGQTVSSTFFDVFRVKPILGRTFVDQDLTSGVRVVIISEQFWASHLGRDPGVLNRTLMCDGVQRIVIGVMPATFQVAYRSDAWTLLTVSRGPEQRKMHYLQVYGRLKDGVSLDQARAQMETLAAGIATIAPESNKGWSVNLQPLRESVVGDDLRTTSLVLAGVALFVLLMGSANVASLLLARGLGRTREIAVRAALGVTPGRLLQQLLTESVLLSVLGGAVGIALAAAILRAAPTLLPAGTLPAGLQLMLDLRLVAFASAVTLATGLLFGLAPAWQAIRLSLADTLRSGGRGASSGAGLRTALAAAEIAIAVMLVAGAGLLLRTLGSLNNVDPGFKSTNVITAQMSLPINRYVSPGAALQIYKRLEIELAAIPGARAVGFGTNLPVDGWDIGQAFNIVGDAPVDSSTRPGAHYQMVDPGWIETLGITLARGRNFTERDSGQSPQVCIVNEEFVRRNLKGRDPIGVRVNVSEMNLDGPKDIEREVVGVIRQAKVDGLGEKADAMEIYVPMYQNNWFSTSIAIRADGNAALLVPAMKEAVARVVKDIPLMRIRTMEEVESETVAQPRFRAQLVGTFALLGLILAAVGIFGVLAFSVNQRMREFGIRMALGAQARDVLVLVMRRGVIIAASGVTVGLLGAAALTGFLKTLLYNVQPLDPMTFIAAPLLLATVALAACAAPAWRASRVNPASALHQE